MGDLSPFLGPLGGFALALSGLVLLARDHRDNDAKRRQEYADSIAFERARTKDAEDRLDAFRETMKEANDVTERAVALAEAAVQRRRA